MAAVPGAADSELIGFVMVFAVADEEEDAQRRKGHHPTRAGE